jgi:hydrogenase/urease accessory protein HupE
MATERSSRWDWVLGAGWVALLLGGAVAFRQDNAFFRAAAYAVVVLFLGYQTVAKLTHRPTPFDSAHGHVGFCLTAAFMVFAGALHVADPQPDTSDVSRVLGGLTCLAGVVMIAAEVRDFRPWRDRMAQDDSQGPWWW